MTVTMISPVSTQEEFEAGLSELASHVSTYWQRRNQQDALAAQLSRQKAIKLSRQLSGVTVRLSGSIIRLEPIKMGGSAHPRRATRRVKLTFNGHIDRVYLRVPKRPDDLAAHGVRGYCDYRGHPGNLLFDPFDPHITMEFVAG